MEENLPLFRKLKGEQGVSMLVEMNEEQYHICLWSKHQLVRFCFKCSVILILVPIILTSHANQITLFGRSVSEFEGQRRERDLMI